MIVLDKRDIQAEEDKKNLKLYKESISVVDKFFPHKEKCRKCKSTILVESFDDYRRSPLYGDYELICPVCKADMDDLKRPVSYACKNIQYYHTQHSEVADARQQVLDARKRELEQGLFFMRIFEMLYRNYKPFVWGIMVTSGLLLLTLLTFILT